MMKKGKILIQSSNVNNMCNRMYKKRWIIYYYLLRSFHRCTIYCTVDIAWLFVTVAAHSQCFPLITHAR